MQRRFAKRDSVDPGSHDVRGYKSFSEAAKDMEELFDIIWVSGTRRLNHTGYWLNTVRGGRLADMVPIRAASLQIPYLLSLALLVTDFLPALPPSPKATFRLIGKLDLAFASLIQGRSLETGELLPGFEGGRGANDTEKVRIKSLVDRTRICVVEVMDAGEFEDESEERAMTEDESMDEGTYNAAMDGDNGWEMEIARVYEKTVTELGDSIGATPRPDANND